MSLGSSLSASLLSPHNGSGVHQNHNADRSNTTRTTTDVKGKVDVNRHGVLDGTNDSHGHAQHKRKRNKPTLNCGPCVERKTKCDRETEPGCGACLRRGAVCVYWDQGGVTSRGKGKGVKHDPDAKSNLTVRPNVRVKTRRRAARSPSPTSVVLERISTSLEPLLSNIPYPTFSAINIYGVGSEHPFKNYWTLSGGLEEVVSVLPSKAQADMLIAKYFDAIDSIFPIIHEGNFYALYENFWRLPLPQRAQVDTSFVALLFVMLALGSQLRRLVALSDDDNDAGAGVGAAAQEQDAINRSDGGEFYASACHQALHLGAYLNRTSIPTLQAMVLMTYFLMNANRGSDGWAFQGIVIRQAYAMGLNRDPNLVNKPKGSLVEQQEKRRLWIAVVCQDASMSVVLKLPPGATHMDVDITAPILALSPDWDASATGTTTSSTTTALDDAVEYPTGIPPTSYGRPSDIGYCNGMYGLALLEQEAIASPRSLSLQIAPTRQERTHLLARFQASFDSWPPLFRTWDEASLCALALGGDGAEGLLGRRIARQIFFLTSHYWHCILLIHVEGCDNAAVDTMGGEAAAETLREEGEWAEHLVSVRGALEAAHKTLRAFFILPELLFSSEAGSWWTMAHRAFAAALTMANLLKKHGQCPTATQTQHQHQSNDHLPRRGRQGRRSSKDSRYDSATATAFATARTDVSRTIGILRRIAHHDDASNACVGILEELYGRGGGREGGEDEDEDEGVG